MTDTNHAEWLRTQIAAASVTQRAVAAAMGLAPATLNKVLKGRRRLQLDEALKARMFFASRGQGRVAGPSPAATPGFAGGDVEPWAPKAPAAAPAQAFTWRVSHHMPGFLLQAGDLLRLDPAATPVPGDLVLAIVPDEAGLGTVTTLRRVAPGWFVSDDWRNLEASLPGTLCGVVCEVLRILRTPATEG